MTNQVLSDFLITTHSDRTKCYTNAGALVEILESIGVDCIFGYPGASVLSIYNELSVSGRIKHYLVRHEQAALHAAEGYARTSGKTGTVLVTSGPGFTNTITGIANAYSDSTPLVILAGDISTKSKKLKSFQNVNINAITSTCAKKTYVLTAKDDIKHVIKEAYNTAEAGNKGPVIIALPRNILEENYKSKICKDTKVHIRSDNYNESVKQFLNLINKAKKPLILIGGGCIDASEEIRNFVSKVNCPVVSTLMGIGIYPSDSELYLGMIGINGTYRANSALNKCDLLISLGASFSDRSTCKSDNFADKKNIISININKFRQNFKLQIQSDINDFLLNLNSVFKINAKYDDWINQLKLQATEEPKVKYISNSLQSSYVLHTLSEFTKNKNTIVVTDVGQHQMLTAQFFNFNKPRRFITSGGMGTMGFGLPAAIGAQIANPDKLVLNITGDGSFQMNLQELATCREHNIPVKIIIMNNGYLGMVRQMQEKIYNNMFQVQMTNPDFVKIAEAYDLFAIRVNSKQELLPALSKAIDFKGTAIVDILIDSFENI